MTNAPVIQMPDMEARRHVGQIIKAHLSVARISGTKLADRIGVDQSTISRKLSGSQTFTFDELVQIAHVLDLPLLDLLQMPKTPAIGGGNVIYGVGTNIHRTINSVGPAGFEPTASSVKSRELADVIPFPARAS